MVGALWLCGLGNKIIVSTENCLPRPNGLEDARWCLRLLFCLKRAWMVESNSEGAAEEVAQVSSDTGFIVIS